MSSIAKPKAEELVRKYYPNAVCERRPWGREYYHVWNQGTLLGKGKTESQAWKAAYRNTYE